MKNADDATALAPPGALRPTLEATREYVPASCSRRARTLYQAHWDDFTEWCVSRAFVALPATPETVAVYLKTRARDGREVGAIELALTAINAAHELAGTMPPGTATLVRETMRGIRRTHGHAAGRRSGWASTS